MPCDGARAPGRPCFFHIFVLIDIQAAGGRAKTRRPALALQAARPVVRLPLYMRSVASACRSRGPARAEQLLQLLA